MPIKNEVRVKNYSTPAGSWAPNKGAQVTWFGPVLAGNKLVLTNALGEVVFANPSDGSIAGKIEGKVPYALPPIVANSTLYTLDDKGRLSAWR